jgi:ATP-dependent Clp protease ATP-binding subunit ClpC
MFERYTEQARRTLFFARFESSRLGSRSIESAHLLLGLLLEPAGIQRLIPDTAAAAIRHQVIDETAVGEPTPTNVEIPFSAPAKSVLMTAAQEADALAHAHIGPEHLLLALVLTPPTDRLLTAHGLTADGLRQRIANAE